MKQARLIGVLTLAAVLLVGCGGEGGTPVAVSPPEESSAAEPTQPSPPAADQTVVTDGQMVSPYPSLPLGFDGGVSGRVVTITVQAGDTVETGELLALLNDAELQRAVEDAERAMARAMEDRELAQRQWEQDVIDAEQALEDAERALSTARLRYSNTTVEEATTALERARQAEADAEQEYKNWLEWYPSIADPYYDRWQVAIRERELAEMRLADAQDSTSTSYLEIEAREDDVAQAERALEALERGVAATYDRAVEDAERQLAEAEETLTHVRLTAPWDAIVLSVDVAPAATIGAGTPVVTLINVEEGLRFVTQNLSEQHVARIQVGQRAMITLRTFPETPIEATVEAVVPQVNNVTGSDARFAVHVRPSPTELHLLPGLTGRVEIFIDLE